MVDITKILCGTMLYKINYDQEGHFDGVH